MNESVTLACHLPCDKLITPVLMSFRFPLKLEDDMVVYGIKKKERKNLPPFGHD